MHSGYTCFITMCVPWESNPQPFALLTQCSTTEPQEQCVTNPSHALLFIHHQMSLAHHIDSCTTLTVAGHPRTTVPIIHCTDDAHTTDCTDHTQLIPICTLFISLGLSLCDCQVLYCVYPSDSYSTEPIQ